MRHKKNFNHLGRKRGHRKAMLSNMASSLIIHKRIKTTVAKAKALKVFVEPLITKAKDDTTHSRRIVFKALADKEATSILFRDVAEKVADRPGGYTRIIKLGNRLGDSADMCIIELVDFNENLLAEKAAEKKSSRRRRGAKKKADVKSPQEEAVESVEETAEDQVPVAEEAVEEPDADVEEEVEEVVEEVKEETTSVEVQEEVVDSESPEAENIEEEDTGAGEEITGKNLEEAPSAETEEKPADEEDDEKKK